LQITNETSSETNKQTDKEMSMEETPVVTNNKVQAVMPKNIVLDPGWFNRDKMKFEDWWRGIQLFLKSNRIIETDNRIIAILTYLRGDVAGIYT